MLQHVNFDDGKSPKDANLHLNSQEINQKLLEQRKLYSSYDFNKHIPENNGLPRIFSTKNKNKNSDDDDDDEEMDIDDKEINEEDYQPKVYILFFMFKLI